MATMTNKEIDSQIDAANKKIALEKKLAAAKEKKAPVKLVERVKNQLNQQALKGKITLDELSDLEQHIKKLAGFLGV